MSSEFFKIVNQIDKLPVVDITKDVNTDNITQVLIYQDATKSTVIDTINITYNNNEPTINGTEYAGMKFNPTTLKMDYLGRLLDQNNSTTDILAPSATFNGIYTDVLEYSEFTCFVSTDVPGTLHMDLSTDGTNLDHTKTVTMDTGAIHTLAIASRFMKIRYVNDTQTQSFLRIQSILHKFKSKELTATSNEIINDQNDVLLMRPVGTHGLDVARGVISDQTSIHKSAVNANVNSAGSPDFINFGGIDPFISTAQQMFVSSTSGNDVLTTGSGCWNVILNGLDANLNNTIEIVDLNGTTSVLTSTSFFRVHFMVIQFVGTYGGSNVGEIKVGLTAGANDVLSIEAEKGQSTSCVFTIPAGITGYLYRYSAFVDSNKAVDLNFFVRECSDITSGEMWGKRTVKSIFGLTGDYNEKFKAPLKINEKSDVWIEGETASGTAGVSVDYEIALINN